MSTKKLESMKRWTVGEARARLPELFKAAARQPQRVFRRTEPAAVIVSPGDFEELSALRTESEKETLADAFVELRNLDAGLEVPERRDRKNGFLDGGR
jgi:prevent-host-death family protein